MDDASLGSGSITHWIHELREGNQSAARHLWSRYVERLIRLANRTLAATRRGAADEEDAVIIAFQGFLKGVEENRFERLDSREDLWQVLCMLTERRSYDLMRGNLAVTRGGGNVRGDSAAPAADCAGGFDQFAGGEPTAEFVVEMQEQLDYLLDILDREPEKKPGQLRSIAMAKLEGFTNEEIADRLSISRATVERRLSFIRDLWSKDLSI